ncbi:MAG TPA: hypothetical protein VE398_19755, partial [Acidobacteriota bacterium]|nr:hypothetical protein [Acidobacteriota bacterium]
RMGAVADIIGKLAAANINVTAIDALCAGSGRFGAILWVKAPDVRKASKALGITAPAPAVTPTPAPTPTPPPVQPVTGGQP